MIRVSLKRLLYHLLLLPLLHPHLLLLHDFVLLNLQLMPADCESQLLCSPLKLNTWYHFLNLSEILMSLDKLDFPHRFFRCSSQSNWVEELVSSPLLTPFSIRQRKSVNIILILWQPSRKIHTGCSFGVFSSVATSSSNQIKSEDLIPLLEISIIQKDLTSPPRPFWLLLNI